jgi:bifunctional DNA-binding transcriptional regulator/antitoxin component of YhaV-PrlF toxin-antitoxin module
VTAFTFSAKLDSKGRITIPAEIREQLNLKQEDTIQTGIFSFKIETRNVESYKEAIELLQEFEAVKSFYYEEGTLEVVLDE